MLRPTFPLNDWLAGHWMSRDFHVFLDLARDLRLYLLDEAQQTIVNILGTHSSRWATFVEVHTTCRRQLFCVGIQFFTYALAMS